MTYWQNKIGDRISLFNLADICPKAWFFYPKSWDRHPQTGDMYPQFANKVLGLRDTI